MFEIPKLQKAVLTYRIENGEAKGKLLRMDKFASLCGLSYDTINNTLTKGQNPSIKTLERICRVLDKKIYEFYS